MPNSIQIKSISNTLHVIPFWNTFICVNMAMINFKFINTARRHWLFTLDVVCLYTSLQYGFFMRRLDLALKKTNVNTASSLNDFVSEGKESHLNKQKRVHLGQQIPHFFSVLTTYTFHLCRGLAEINWSYCTLWVIFLCNYSRSTCVSRNSFGIHLIGLCRWVGSWL